MKLGVFFLTTEMSEQFQVSAANRRYTELEFIEVPGHVSVQKSDLLPVQTQLTLR